jgi:hypothetical protein
MSKYSVTAACIALAAALPMLGSVAQAHSSKLSARDHVAGHAYPYVQLRRGYSRAGPPYGPGFGFATYAGDPFATDDYYDGGRCYYLHHRDVCMGINRPLDPFE